MSDTTDSDTKHLLISLAHEINTPLVGILADAENLVYELKEKDPELLSLAEHQLNQVQRLSMLTHTVMAVLSGQQPSREFHIQNIYRPVKEACDMFENEASAKGCEILGPEPIKSKFPDIEMSSFDLTLAFKNIINNAVKYSFRPANNDRRRYIRVTGYWADSEHKNYSISVQNYGVGISPHEINKIFEPYYRGQKASDRRRTGSGFGLAHASQIIKEMHHGEIEVSSRPEGGEAFLTNFVVTLPVRQPAASNSETKNA